LGQIAGCLLGGCATVIQQTMEAFEFRHYKTMVESQQPAPPSTVTATGICRSNRSGRRLLR
jgi:hypothetical protein